MLRSDKTVCTNWGGYQFFHVDLSAVSRRAVIRSATLSVYETDTLRGSGVVGVHRVTTPWAEGTGINACTGDGATWPATGLEPSWLAPGGPARPSRIATTGRMRRTTTDSTRRCDRS